MKFEIKAMSGAVAFTAEIDCDEWTTHAVRLGLAVRVAIAARADLNGADLRWADLGGANLSGANLYGANLSGANLRVAYLSRANLTGANLSRTYLSGADLSGANLRVAYLSGADLRGANLSRADLRGANLRGADKIEKRVSLAERSDGFHFVLYLLQDGTERVVAGCRYFTLAQFREHVATEYPGTSKAVETLQILDFLELRLAAPK